MFSYLYIINNALVNFIYSTYCQFSSEGTCNVMCVVSYRYILVFVALVLYLHYLSLVNIWLCKRLNTWLEIHITLMLNLAISVYKIYRDAFTINIFYCASRDVWLEEFTLVYPLIKQRYDILDLLQKKSFLIRRVFLFLFFI